jgi:hypothetical protein
VVPEEEAVPAGLLGLDRQIGHHPRIGEHVERRYEQPAPGHRGCSRPGRSDVVNKIMTEIMTDGRRSSSTSPR